MKVLLDAFHAETFDSPVAGEGRWALNLGHMMALNGHEVAFTRSGVADWCSNLLTDYDIFFHAGYLGDGHGASVVVHGQVSFSSAARETRRLGFNHFVVLPFTVSLERLRLDALKYGWSPEEYLSFTRVMPWPCIERIEWGKSNEDAPLLAYCNQGTFEEHNRGTPELVIASETMRMALDIAEELGLELHMFRIEDSPCLPNDLRGRLFGSHRSPALVIHGRIPRPEVLEILGRTRLLFSDVQTTSNMPVEAIALGAVVPIWHGGYLDPAGSMCFEYRADLNYIRGHVMESLRRICTDRQMFHEGLDALRQSARKYTYEEAYPENLSVLQNMLDKVKNRA